MAVKLLFQSDLHQLLFQQPSLQQALNSSREGLCRPYCLDNTVSDHEKVLRARVNCAMSPYSHPADIQTKQSDFIYTHTSACRILSANPYSYLPFNLLDGLILQSVHLEDAPTLPCNPPGNAEDYRMTPGTPECEVVRLILRIFKKHVFEEIVNKRFELTFQNMVVSACTADSTSTLGMEAFSSAQKLPRAPNSRVVQCCEWQIY
jgi:hypothetical protein